jgi:hypothetical protein
MRILSATKHGLRSYYEAPEVQLLYNQAKNSFTKGRVKAVLTMRARL